MGLELTNNEAADLVTRTKRLLAILADAWDPDSGLTTEVANKYLEEADQLSSRWQRVEWVALRR